MPIKGKAPVNNAGEELTGKEDFSARNTDRAYGSIDSAEDRDAVFRDINNLKFGRATFHKSFDFSNAALFADRDEGIPGDNSAFRRFHQMTMYIQVPGFNSHAGYKGTGYQTMMITSNLPEQVSYDVGSSWSAPLNFGNATTNLIMQMVGPKLSKSLGSGVSRVTTMKIWDGSKPLSLTLKIPVIDDGGTDSKTNLVEALEVLGSLSLPRYGGSGFYIPPPSPLRASITYATGFEDGKPSGKGSWSFATGGAYGRIMVQLGGILLVDYCVIDGFSVNYPNTKTMIRHDYTGLENFGTTGQYYLHPLLAEVTLKISTIEAMTSEFYSQMLWARPQHGSGDAKIDVSTGLLGYLSASLVKTGDYLGLTSPKEAPATGG